MKDRSFDEIELKSIFSGLVDMYNPHYKDFDLREVPFEEFKNTLISLGQLCVIDKGLYGFDLKAAEDIVKDLQDSKRKRLLTCMLEEYVLESKKALKNSDINHKRKRDALFVPKSFMYNLLDVTPTLTIH